MFLQETVLTIDPQRRRVATDEATYDADFLVVALGADYDLAATPGFVEGGFEYYSVAGAERLRDELPSFRGGKVLLAVGSGATGGFSVPFQLDGTLVPSSAGSRNPFRAICRTELISGSNEWRLATSGAMVASYASEALPASDNAPTLAQPVLRTARVQAFAPASIELAGDWGAILDQLGGLIQSAKDDLETTKFTTGSGTNEPRGLITAGQVFFGSAGSFTLPNLYDMEKDLGPRFRVQAQWLAHRDRLQDVRRFVLPSAAPVWEHLVGGPSEILGYPVSENSGMSSSVTTGSKIFAFGAPEYVDRVGLDLEVASHIFDTATGFPRGQRGIYALWRNTADLLVASSWRILTTT